MLPSEQVHMREHMIDADESLAHVTSLADIADLVRQVARRVTEADGATFVLREEDFCFYVDEDAIAPLWKGQRFPITACISGWAMLHAQPAVVPDISASSRAITSRCRFCSR